MFTSLALLFALSTSTPAEAGVVVSIGLPGFTINAWSPHYVPAARSGWSWAAGHYDAWGQWHPGHWRPVSARAGYDWVPGYWVGAHYYDGYWRSYNRVGYSWVSGYYSRGAWCEGYWHDGHNGRVYERHEARQEYREDRHEAREDRHEYREDRQERVEDRHEDREDRQDRHDDRREARDDRHDRGDDRSGSSSSSSATASSSSSSSGHQPADHRSAERGGGTAKSTKSGSGKEATVASTKLTKSSGMSSRTKSKK